MANLTCDIVTPTAHLLSTECMMVVVPGAEGEMGFMKGHAPTVSTLADGVVRIHSDLASVSHRVVLQGGYVQMSGEKAIILADRACPVEQIDLAAAESALSSCEERLASAEASEKALLELDQVWNKLLVSVAKGA